MLYYNVLVRAFDHRADLITCRQLYNHYQKIFYYINSSLFR